MRPIEPSLLRRWLPLGLGSLLAISALEAANAHFNFAFEGFALGAETQFASAVLGGETVLCMRAEESPGCVASYNRAGRPPAILWLGNSQLPGVNRLKSGDLIAPVLLHEAVRPRGYYAVSYAHPNANLFEHALDFAALTQLYDVKLLILPVFLDDIREQGIREYIAALLEEPAAREAATRTKVWPLIGPLVRNARKPDAGSPGQPPSFQQDVETALNTRIGAAWPLWSKRDHLRGMLAIAVHYARNRLLGINAQTKRKVDAAAFAEKMSVLDAILAEARERQIKVLLYLPPYRQDISGPYLDADYALLKTELARLARQYDVRYVNLDDVVPGPEWGLFVDTVLGIKDYDFMHFTGEGHRRHASAIDAELRQMGF